MDVSTILLSTAILAGVGTTFAVLIALARRRLWVWEDPRLDAVADMLPGTNCGACGRAGCRAFADALVAGTIEPATCTVMGPEDREDVRPSHRTADGDAVLLRGGSRHRGA